MKRDEALDILLARAGQRQGDTTLKDQLVKEMKMVQKDFEYSGVDLPIEQGGGVFWPWFLLSEISTGDIIEGTHKISVPDDFIMGWEYGALWLYDSNKDDPWKLLEKASYDYLRANYSEDLAEPVAYALSGDNFYLFPASDGEYQLKIIYYQAAQELGTNIENVWLFYAPQLLIAKVGEIMAGMYLHDQNLQNRFLRQMAEQSVKTYNATVAREMENYEVTKGGDN